MAPLKITGVARLGGPYRKTPRITSTHKEIGVWHDTQDREHHTRLQLWVPTPQRPGDRPGVFLSLSNSNGQCFTRIDPVELDECIAWMQSVRATLLLAYQTATEITTEYRTIAKQVTANRQNQQERQKTEENNRALEEDGLRSIMELEPFEEA